MIILHITLQYLIGLTIENINILELACEDCEMMDGF